jgi:hypothetical protein
VSKIEKLGVIALALFCVLWALFFGYLIFVMPDYGTNMFTH